MVERSTVLPSDALGDAKACQAAWDWLRGGFPRLRAAFCTSCALPRSFLPCRGSAAGCSPQGVPAPATRRALRGEPLQKPRVNHLVLMHEVIEQSCTH